jgi:Flp pilus assembly protein TadD
MSAPAHGRWAPRIALAVGIPLLAFLGLEGGLRFAGYGRPATFLIPDDKPGYFRTNPDFASLFLPGNFDLRPLNLRIAEHKAPNTVRIVVLGESAAQGVPVPSFAFAPQLRAQLRHRYPGKEFEVINTGIVAINSHVVYQIAREMARFEPDIFVVYMGNNEVVGPYGPGCAYLSTMPPLWVIRASVFVRSTRTGQLLGSLVGRLSPRMSAAEWGGMSMFVNNAVAGDDPRLGAVYGNFEANLRGIVDAASGAGARTLLCTVVANLKDCPPLLSRHSQGLSTTELADWQVAFDHGRVAWMLGDNPRARELLNKALGIDPHFADTLFMLGSLDLQSGDTAAARKHFTDALHWDSLRFRPDTRINEIVREVAREAKGGASLLDSALALGSDPASNGPPSGRDILFEHVHFDWPGNYRLARLMARSAAASIFGGDPGDSGWLDEAACAGAVAYTPHERLPMLLRIEVLVRKPPFTNQLTHVEDEAQLYHQIEAARKEALLPSVLEGASVTVKAALTRDPDNPALLGVLEGVDLDQGNDEDALAVSRRLAELLPLDFAPAADEASILKRLGRYDEADEILRKAAVSSGDADMLAPLVVDLRTRTKGAEEGIRFLDSLIIARPQDYSLQVLRAGLRRASRDVGGAESDLRAVLAQDPSNAEALEALVALLNEAGRGDLAAKESTDAAEHQPRNQDNSLRAARECEARGDLDGWTRNMEAAELSGPVTATFELTLALKLYQLKRMDGVMLHLAEARRLSVHEGSASVTESIDKLVGRMRAETGMN